MAAGLEEAPVGRAERPPVGGPSIGANVPRKEGRGKVTGAARYVDDVVMDGMLYGATVRSPVARGRIVGVHYDPAFDWSEVVVVTAADVPARNLVTLILEDQPVLADGVVNHPEEAVVLLAHPDRWYVEEARRHVRLEIEPLPAVLDIDAALAAETVIWGDDNVLKRIDLAKGDVDAAFAAAAGRDDVVVVEGVYETGAQEQLYIEPQGMIAVAAPGQGVTVWGSLQCPYYVHKALVPMFGLPEEQVRVVQMTTGGGFGGKEEYPSMIAGHAALLSWKAGGRPVKLIYDRAEDMVATTKRHPSRTRHRTLVTRDGELLAMDIDFVLDGGAYATLSAVVLSRGTIHAAGPYRVPHVRVTSRAVATNLPPHGAFRGFGAPQSIFAVERHLDKVAKALGMTPEALRRRNLLNEGDTTATGQTVTERIDLPRMMRMAMDEARWDERKRAYAEHNAVPGQTVLKGLGLATFFHGSGFTGSGESYLASVVHAEATAEGRVVVLAASTEIGQGTNTIFSQVASDALGLPYEWVDVAQPDTAAVPDSGPTVASRTTMVVGKLVERAALGLRDKLQAEGLLGREYTPEQFAEACAAWHASRGRLLAASEYKAPPGVVWDDATYRGSAYGSYGWACYVAAVAVDTVTWETRVEDFVAVQDIGTVIHPVLAAGQVEGGVAQGIGWALSEEVVWKDGRMANGRMTNYIMPTAMDLPDLRVFFQPVPYEHGPAGAKGVGELPMDGPAPAIVNAIEDALGVAVDAIPVTPERLMRAVKQAEAARG